MWPCGRGLQFAWAPTAMFDEKSSAASAGGSERSTALLFPETLKAFGPSAWGPRPVKLTLARSTGGHASPARPGLAPAVPETALALGGGAPQWSGESREAAPSSARA